VLASASPRRRELLAALGLSFEVVATDVDESPLADETARGLALRLAGTKVAAVAAARPGAIILGADTVVTLAGELFGKPAHPAEAAEMLGRLRARRHEVVTGVCVWTPTGKRLESAVRTAVHMRDYTDSEIARYVGTGRAYDKAGAYAIQDPEFRPVAGIIGCYSNVVGLPLCLTAELLRRAGVLQPTHAPACQHFAGHARSGTS
jgi:MAF protein